MVNHLEQLVSEWYEYCGYFVRKNVLVGKRATGGYEGELNIVAFNPKTKHLVQVEPYEKFIFTEGAAPAISFAQKEFAKQ